MPSETSVFKLTDSTHAVFTTVSVYTSFTGLKQSITTKHCTMLYNELWTTTKQESSKFSKNRPHIFPCIATGTYDHKRELNMNGMCQTFGPCSAQVVCQAPDNTLSNPSEHIQPVTHSLSSCGWPQRLSDWLFVFSQLTENYSWLSRVLAISVQCLLVKLAFHCGWLHSLPGCTA